MADFKKDAHVERELSADLATLFLYPRDGPTIDLSAETLRIACKCAHCQRARFDGRFPAQFPGLAIVGINDLGYGLNIVFSDGHNRGIYPNAYLVGLADCPT